MEGNITDETVANQIKTFKQAAKGYYNTKPKTEKIQLTCEGIGNTDYKGFEEIEYRKLTSEELVRYASQGVNADTIYRVRTSVLVRHQEYVIKYTNKYIQKPKITTVIKTIKKSKVKRLGQTIKKVIKVTGAKGKVTYKKVGGDSGIAINSKTGAITMKKHKCPKKLRYHYVKVKVNVAGTNAYAAFTKTLKVKIKML